jgi:hypothetical protein
MVPVAGQGRRPGRLGAFSRRLHLPGRGQRDAVHLSGTGAHAAAVAAEPEAAMSFLRRIDVPGNEPLYQFRSPCCQMTETRPAWIVQQAKHQGGMLRMQCGRTATDPLRIVKPNGRNGCGSWFTEDITDLP